ncbi:MAG: HEAT repeat domain-containing protein, partial [Anaerolineales bacterium]
MDNGWPAALIALKGVAPQQRREAALRLAGHPSPQTYAALLNALGDPDPRAHEAIIHALVQQTNSDNLAHLVDVLREDHPARRNAALSTLIEIGAPKPDILTSALRHPASHVRLRIAEVLGDLCDARTTPALLDCLNNPTEAPDVRHAAAQALGKIGDPAATPALASAAEQGEFWVRYAAVEALGRIGDPKAVEPLLRLMDDVWMRPAVVTAFGEIGHLRAVEALAATLDDPNEAVRAASVEALVKIVLEPGARDIPEPEKLNEIRRLIPVAALQREVKTGTVPTSAYAAHLLGWLAQPEALPDLIATLGHADEAIRHATLEAILRYGEAAIPELLAALTDPQARVREHVAELLGMLGDSRVTPALLEHANDTEIAVRQSILRALGSVGGEAAYAGLLHALRDPATRDTALGVLGQVRGSRLIGSLKDYLQHYLYDGQPEMRGAAAEALSLFGDEVSVSILLNAIRQPDETTRRPAAEALAHMRGGRA